MQNNEEINILKQDVLKMYKDVKTNLEQAFDCLLKFDSNKEYTLIDDTKIDAQERKIEQKCLHLMLTERLFAYEIRFVPGVMCLVQDLERLGDHAQDIQHFALKLKQENISSWIKLKKLISFVFEMVENAIKAFDTSDAELAKKVISDDDHVDQVYELILKELIEKDQEHIITSSYALYTTLIDKYIERIADHATNIAEWSIFIILGYYKDAQII